MFFFLNSRTKPQQYKSFMGLFLTAVTCFFFVNSFFSPTSCHIMKFLGRYLTIATALVEMKIVTWVIPYARDGSNASPGAVDEALTLGSAVGYTGDTLTSPPGFGSKSKLGFLPWAGVFSCCLQDVMGAVVIPWQLPGWEAKCGQVKSRQSQGPCAWWAALGSTAAALPCGVGTLEVRSSRF